MQHRGVVVAIAGRRDGVRVYALEEVRRAVEWRMEVEIRREREKMRRETPKRSLPPPSASKQASWELINKEKISEEGGEAAVRKSSLSTLDGGSGVSVGSDGRKKLHRRSSIPPLPASAPSTPAPPPVLIPRTPTLRRAKAPGPKSPLPPTTPAQEVPLGNPPTYDDAVASSAASEHRGSIGGEDAGTEEDAGSIAGADNDNESQSGQETGGSGGIQHLRPAARRASIVGVLSRGPVALQASTSGNSDDKTDWRLENGEESEEEAIDVVAAGSSGSQALDERTSSVHAQAHSQSSLSHRSSTSVSSATHTLITPASGTDENDVASGSVILTTPTGSPGRPRSMSTRRNRPANLDLTLTRIPTTTTIVPPEPSPAPTLLSLRHALTALDTSLPTSSSPSASPIRTTQVPTIRSTQLPLRRATTPGYGEDDEDDADGGTGLSLAEMLNESRLPDLPPAGTRRPQQPIWIMGTHAVATGEEDGREGTGAVSPGTTMRQPQRSASQAGSRSRPTTAGSGTGGEGTQRSTTSRRRRRWSVFDGVITGGQDTPASSTNVSSAAPTPEPPGSPRSGRSVSALLTRSSSSRTTRGPGSSHSLASPSADSIVPPVPIPPPLPELLQAGPRTTTGVSPTSASAAQSRSRFIPRIISNAFRSPRADEPHHVSGVGGAESVVLGGGHGNGSGAGGSGSGIMKNGSSHAPGAPPPKLEYVKLPGTKGALLVKAVETAKKRCASSLWFMRGVC